MTNAMRYLLAGLLCACVAGLFAQAWHVVVMAFASGCILGLVAGFLLSEAGDWMDRDK